MADKDGLDRFEFGGYWRVDDISGERIRAYNTHEQWDGAITGPENFSPRHPQEFLRSVKDDQHVDKARPVPPPLFVGPTETTLVTAATFGATSLNVVSTVGFAVGDQVGVMLDNMDRFLGAVKAVPDSTHLTLTSGLPFSAAIGNLVLDYQPVPPPAL